MVKPDIVSVSTILNRVREKGKKMRKGYFTVTGLVVVCLTMYFAGCEKKPTEVDSTPPAPPTGLQALPGNNIVNLSWNKNTEADLNMYRIYRAITSSTSFSKLTDIGASVTTFNDTEVTNGTKYFYKLTAIDKTNNESGYSDIVSVTPEPANTAPTASFSVSPISGDLTTVFTVNASASRDNEDPRDSLQVKWDWENDGKWDTDWSFEKVLTHQYSLADIYTIALKVKDTGGLTSCTSQVVYVAEDITPPIDVTDFRGRVEGYNIVLSWINPPDEDFTGVRIVRKIGDYPSDVNDGTVVYDGIGTTYVDPNLSSGVVYYYRAYAHDDVPNYSHGVTTRVIFHLFPENGYWNGPTTPGDYPDHRVRFEVQPSPQIWDFTISFPIQCDNSYGYFLGGAIKINISDMTFNNKHDWEGQFFYIYGEFTSDTTATGYYKYVYTHGPCSYTIRWKASKIGSTE